MTTWTRVVVAGALATAVSIAIGASGGQAALDFDSDNDPETVEELTRFQIDGDKVPGASSNVTITPAPGVDFDWTSQPYGPQPVGSNPALLAPEGVGSSGLLPLLFENIESNDFPNIIGASPNPAFGRFPGEDPFCTGNKEDGWSGGTDLNDVKVDDPVVTVDGDQALECMNVLGKGDLFNAYAAYETVAVPSVWGDPDSGTENRTIVYGAWERGDVAGEIFFFIPLVDDDKSGNSAGDRLIAFDYDSNSGDVSFRILAWDGDSWEVESAGDSGDSSGIFAGAVGLAGGGAFDPDAGGGSVKPTFGEFALDITAAGILPVDSEGGCVELSTGGFVFTQTGNADGSPQLKDYVGTPSLPIGNCGPVSVTKAGPAGAPDGLLFDYRLEQLDSEPIFETVPATTPASTETQLNSQFEIGDTQQWEVFAEPDYFAFENPLEVGGSSPAPLPEGWEMTAIACTYIDAFDRVDNMPVLVENQVLWSKDGGRLLDENGDEVTLQVHSAAFNELAGMPGFVPGCTITNSFTGVTVTKAGVGDDTQEFDITIDGESVSPALTIGDTSELQAVVAGETVTVDEPNLPDGWLVGGVVCSYEGPNGTVVVEESSTVPIEFTAVDGQVVDCVVTNNQLPVLTLVKQVDNDNGGSAEAGEWTLEADGPTSLTGSTGISDDVLPGTYDLSETGGPDDYTLTSLTCDDDPEAEVTSVILEYGDDVTCTFVNDDDAPSLKLVKEVINDNGGSAESGEWTLVADGYDAELPQIGSYDLFETGGPDDYTQVSLTCDDDPETEVTSVTLGLGDDVTCTFVNDDDAPSLTLVKQVVNDDGGNAVAGDWTLTAAGYDAQNPQAGTYALSESGGPQGYTLTSLTCDNAQGQVTSVTLGIGDDVTCTFVNDDEPVDLELTKDDGGVTTVAGGDPFEYTITVQNIGDRDADLDEPVTVTDTLPSQFEWVSFPDTCEQAGQVLTCDVDPALLPAGGDPVEIVASAQARAGTPAGTYINKATVTTEDDPGTNPPCPATSDNNTDCDGTPVLEADLAIIKTASVAQVGPGGSFEWQLDITNNGPATAINVVIGDVVPGTLVVTGVSSSDFDCSNDGNAVECTVDSLAVGDGGTVTIDVDVPVNATAGDIVNVGTVESDTPDPDLSNNSDDAVVTVVVQLPPLAPPPPVTLPPTGSNLTADVTQAAMLLLAGGAMIVLIARRRREETVTAD